MKKKANKHIQKDKLIRGLGVTGYCYACQRNFLDECKADPKFPIPISECPNSARHILKAYIWTKDGKRIAKALKATSVQEALLEAAALKKKVWAEKESSPDVKIEPVAVQNVERENKPTLLAEAMAKYVAWLRGENVPSHLVKNRDLRYIADIERALELMAECLASNGYNLSSLKLTAVDDRLVGVVYDHLLNVKNYSPRSVDKHLSYYTTFFTFIEEEITPIRNWFERAKRIGTPHNPESITQTEFASMMKGIEEGKIMTDPNSKAKSYATPAWLKQSFTLALYTGARREELVNIRFSDIIDDGENSYVRIENRKVNRIRNLDGDKRIFVYLPLTNELKQVLVQECNYAQLKGTDEYVLAPQNKSRNHMMALMTRGFTFYYNQLNTCKSLHFRSLRKSYVTSLTLHLGKQLSLTHSDKGKTMEEFYLDKRVMANAAAKDFKVFPDREIELQNLRESKEINASKTIEK